MSGSFRDARSVLGCGDRGGVRQRTEFQLEGRSRLGRLLQSWVARTITKNVLCISRQASTSHMSLHLTGKHTDLCGPSVCQWETGQLWP